jgi:ABC-type glycerol-3-phosphate transport system substrate-binding protein
MTVRKTTPRRARRLMLGITTLATTLVIAACGSSSTTSTSTSASTATSTTAAASASAGTSANRAAFAKCLQQHGVTLPKRTPGSGAAITHSGPPPAGSAGGSQGSSTRQAAFKACGASGLHKAS